MEEILYNNKFIMEEISLNNISNKFIMEEINKFIIKDILIITFLTNL